MTEPSQYFKGRTVQEQMNEVIGYVDTRAAEVATTAIASDVAQVHQDMLDADADAQAAAASAAAAAGTLANAVKKTGEASQSIAGDIAVAGDLTGGTVTVPAPVNNTDAASKKYVDDADALDAKLVGATFTGQLNASGQRAYSPGNTTDVATIGTLDAYTPMVRTSGNQSISGVKIIQHIGGNLGTYARFSAGTYVKIAEFEGNTTNTVKISILKGGRYSSGIFTINFNLASDHTISGLTGSGFSDNPNLTIFGVQYNPNSDKYEVLVSSTLTNELSTFIFLVSVVGAGIRIDMTIPDTPAAVNVQTGKQEVTI